MSKQKALSPSELWECLLHINPQHFNGTPDIDMLRGYYQRYLDREESKIAKSSFQEAKHDWNDEQSREFVYLLSESPVSWSMSSTELHNALTKVYKLIFEI